MQNQLLKNRKRDSTSAAKNQLDISNISRDNIKQNTQNLKEEINDIDDEIVALQGTLLSALKMRNRTEERGGQEEADITLDLDHSTKV